jgi:hypothetical protein
LTRRNFLFLQGPASSFFARLADRLSALGHGVFRINFCAGDRAYWGARPARNHRSGALGLAERLEAVYREHGITDQILFGDQRPVHRAALDQGAAYGVRTHVFEEGYFRPWWVTLERDGVNAHTLDGLLTPAGTSPSLRCRGALTRHFGCAQRTMWRITRPGCSILCCLRDTAPTRRSVRHWSTQAMCDDLEHCS